MTTLNDQQKQLLFDYSLGLTSECESDEVEALITGNEDAVEFYQCLQRTLAPLDTVEMELCPEGLTERLYLRMRELAPAEVGQDRLRELLTTEQSGPRVVRVRLWRNWSEVVAAAAVIALFVSILFPTVAHMRGQYWKTQCGSQQGNIYQGLSRYVSDHDGLLPSAAMTPGQLWWKVGYQGQENYSNTRQVWPLVQQGYVDPSQFLCPGRPDGRRLNFDGFNLQDFRDFPSRAYMHFSIRIPCPTGNDRNLTQKRVLMADRNPLSEGFPSNLNGSLKLRLCDKVLTSNSPNHRGRGQNVLLYDGSVEFARTRRTSLSDDDIYLLRDMSPGTEIRGCEFPSSDMDFFLAP